MPYEVKKNESGKYCLHKKGEMEAMACHDTEEEAMAQMRAVMANEGAKAVKFADDNEDVIEGLGMPFGGIFNGQDLAGEHFSVKTDFCFEWFTERPLLYHHGLDANAGSSVIGRVKSWKKTDLGVWVQAQLDASSEYFEAVKELVRKGKLFFSSGAMSHLVETDKGSGEIKRWPWVELSTTPTPCNLLATLDFATAKSHFKAIGIDLPVKLALTDMPDMDGEEHREMVEKKPAKMGIATDESYETLIEQLYSLINPYNPFTHDCWSSIIATFPDHCIVSRWDSGEQTYWDVAYTIGEDGKPVLGKMTEVEQAYEPVKSELPEMPLMFQASITANWATSLLERTKDLHERRVKEGRQMSAANRKRMRESMEAMRKTMDEMMAFLDSTEPQQAKAADVRLLQSEILRTYIAANTI